MFMSFLSVVTVSLNIILSPRLLHLPFCHPINHHCHPVCSKCQPTCHQCQPTSCLWSTHLLLLSTHLLPSCQPARYQSPYLFSVTPPVTNLPACSQWPLTVNCHSHLLPVSQPVVTSVVTNVTSPLGAAGCIVLSPLSLGGAAGMYRSVGARGSSLDHPGAPLLTIPGLLSWPSRGAPLAHPWVPAGGLGRPRGNARLGIGWSTARCVPHSGLCGEGDVCNMGSCIFCESRGGTGRVAGLGCLSVIESSPAGDQWCKLDNFPGQWPGPIPKFAIQANNAVERCPKCCVSKNWPNLGEIFNDIFTF